MQFEPAPHAQAFGELFGLEVPTRYPEETHHFINQIMAADCLVTPLILRMRFPTVWLCRALAGLLLVTGRRSNDLSLRSRLTFEVVVGLAVMITALSRRSRIRTLERLYLAFGGLLMVANALMTQDPDTQGHK
jgi:hypothetical protein